jgi:hypothetical protein
MSTKMTKVEKETVLKTKTEAVAFAKKFMYDVFVDEVTMSEVFVKIASDMGMTKPEVFEMILKG